MAPAPGCPATVELDNHDRPTRFVERHARVVEPEGAPKMSAAVIETATRRV